MLRVSAPSATMNVFATGCQGRSDVKTRSILGRDHLVITLGMAAGVAVTIAAFSSPVLAAQGRSPEKPEKPEKIHVCTGRAMEASASLTRGRIRPPLLT